jgi:UDP-3-O-[3-hydroxymyristoyl] glucosamine N-acyltransferase
VIEDDVKLFSGVVISNNVQLGKGSILHAGVKVYNDCLIGKQVIIHAGTVIGSDGFGFAPLTDGTFKKYHKLEMLLLKIMLKLVPIVPLIEQQWEAPLLKKVPS